MRMSVADREIPDELARVIGMDVCSDQPKAWMEATA